MEGTYNDFCRSKKCPEHIEWEFRDLGSSAWCESCKKIGQSYDITQYPEDCNFLEEIKEFQPSPTDNN